MKRRPAALAVIVSIGSVATVVAASAWLTSRSLQQDFAAYWIAGSARRLGLDPYLNQVGSSAAPTLWDGIAIFRHSRFLYPPLVAELFRPLAALPYRIAKVLFTAGMLAAWIGAGLLSSGRRGRTWFFLASALFFPLYRHLERGQIDLLVLLLLAVAWRTRARFVLAGAALALAATIKPALLALLPVLWAGGRARLARAALGATAAIFGLTMAVAGPARLREYVCSVLPRAALYGEGGTDDMLLPAERFPAGARDDGTARLDGSSYRTTIWEVPAAASVPRLLAPESPTLATNLFPFALAILGLCWATRRRHARPGDDELAEEMLLYAAAVACVVASPAGWVMGLVVALPIVADAAERFAGGGLAPRAALALSVAWIAVALPAPFAGFPALAGSALCAATAAAACDPRARTPPRVPA